MPGTTVRSRGLIGLPVAVALLLGACGDSNTKSDDPTRQPFYMEAEISVLSQAETVGTNLPPPDRPTISTVRWWSRDTTHTRWEFPGFVGVLDGERMWIYDKKANTYGSTPIPALPEDTAAFSLPVSILIGPANAATIDEFIDDISPRFDSVIVAGEDQWLGRPVTVVEARPASRSSGSSGSGPTVERTHGAVRFWVDEERMFVLRYQVVEDPVQEVDATVTRLDYPAHIPDSVVSFAPPPGATETKP